VCTGDFSKSLLFSELADVVFDSINSFLKQSFFIIYKNASVHSCSSAAVAPSSYVDNMVIQ
jgi:hypothetical protein